MSTAAVRSPEEALAGFPIELIAADKIDRSPYQSRTIDLKSPKLLELSRSIAEQGVLQPLTIRPGKVDGRWELVMGERRLRASILAGHTYVPCILRHTMTDAEAALAVVTENKQREELHPLEQGLGVQILLDQGLEAALIADKLGYTKAWVYHLAALTRLTERWQKAVREPVDEEKGRTYGPRINAWTIQHLEEVARLPAETQDRLLKLIEERQSRRPNLEDLRRAIADLTHQLGKAGFPLDDELLLRGAPSCLACPKREGMAPTLFGIEEEREVKEDRCLDKSCFNRKVDAWTRRQVREVKTKHPEAIEVKKVEGYRYSNTPDFTARGQGYVKAKKADKDAVLAVVTSRSGAGQQVYVKPSGEADGRGARFARATLNIKTLREGLKQYRQILGLVLLVEHLKSQTWADLNRTTGPAMDLLRLLGAVDGFGGEDHYPDFTPSSLAVWAKKSDEQVLEEIWIGVRESLFDQFSAERFRDDEGLAAMMKENPVPEQWMASRLPEQLKAAQAVCVLFHLEWREFLAAASQALPEPAEWKGLKATDVPGKPATTTKASGAGKAKKTVADKKAAANDKDEDPDIDEPDDRYEGEDHEEEDLLPEEAE